MYSATQLSDAVETAASDSTNVHRQSLSIVSNQTEDGHYSDGNGPLSVRGSSSEFGEDHIDYGLNPAQGNRFFVKGSNPTQSRSGFRGQVANPVLGNDLPDIGHRMYDAEDNDLSRVGEQGGVEHVQPENVDNASLDLEDQVPEGETVDDEEEEEEREEVNVGHDPSSEGKWLTYDELMLDSYPAKSKIIYLKAYKTFERYLKSQKQFVQNAVPSEIQILNYFHYLKNEKHLAPTTLWSTYSRVNACVKRLFGFSLKTYVRVTDVLKSYESGYKVKKASIFTPQEVFIN